MSGEVNTTSPHQRNVDDAEVQEKDESEVRPESSESRLVRPSGSLKQLIRYGSEGGSVGCEGERFAGTHLAWSGPALGPDPGSWVLGPSDLDGAARVTRSRVSKRANWRATRGRGCWERARRANATGRCKYKSVVDQEWQPEASHVHQPKTKP